MRLIAIPRECDADDFGVAIGGGVSAAKVPLALVAHPRRQVAGARRTVLRLAFGGQTETLFGTFVGFLLRHGIGCIY